MAGIAVVTGASSGVGREFVRQLDHGAGGPLDELWVVARSADKLEAISEQCQTPVRVFALDLLEESSYESLRDALDDQEEPVQWLINSAGFGKFGSFDAIPEEANANMVRLNCLAVVETIYHCLPHMVSGSRIVNMASIAGLIPQPGLSTYSATKRFVLDLSRTLDYELGPVGIHVTAVCPKFMDTGFLNDPGDQRQVRRMTTIGFEKPEDVVRKALHAAVLGRSTCVTSPDMAAAALLAKILPANLVMKGQDLLFTARAGE
ncbi:MAG: SDR family NAD(P)-dependent oxidoreductase [Tractidigestivibacter sp.]|uniref:SDR family NAD(P)-dependent oxidoreductase n=1 Tax=Tractidigestivibacter sp. TaxID=2847320 RepID=UPI003D8E14A6